MASSLGGIVPQLFCRLAGRASQMWYLEDCMYKSDGSSGLPRKKVWRSLPLWQRMVGCTAAVALAPLFLVAAPSADAKPSPAPLKAGHGKVIPNKYIVVLNDDASGSAVARRNAVKTDHVYSAAISGFSASLTKSQLAKVRKDSSVKYVEPDGVVTTSDKPRPAADPKFRTKTPSQLKPQSQSGDVSTETTQAGATWGIDRIDQRTGINGTYNYTDTGAGVTAYVIDTGIRTTHTQFGTRASVGYDALGGTGQDCNGHGTHVAGTIGGSTYGVAKGVRLVAVRVLDCSGSGAWSSVIAGIDYVTYAHNGPSVANMSLGGGLNTAVNDAVARSTARGVTYAVAAGNSNANACSYSPSSAPSAITVGATGLSGSTDVRASFSNYGSCVDVFDPGVNITSAWYSSNTATAVLSGTSMASPHVAGLAALYLQGNPTAAPATVDDVIKTTAVTGIVSSPGTGSPNRFARKWNGILSGTGANSYQPDGSYWYQVNPGYIQGWLAGTPGTDADLYLERWTGTAWVYVTGSASVTPRERIVYNGAGATYYRFRVYAYSGGGSYDVWSNHPS